jgi:DNA-binding NtrC family response regulator
MDRGAGRRILCSPDIPNMTSLRFADPRPSSSAIHKPESTIFIDPPLVILSVSATSEDHDVVRRSVSGMNCRVRTAETCRGALQSLIGERISIVICERDLPDGGWRDLLEHDAASPQRPSLIVTSRLADDRLWAEVLNLGGCDVLAKPFNAVETKHVLETACLGRRDYAQRTAAAG